MTDERFRQILDAFLGDPDLVASVNQCKTFEDGYYLVTEKIPDLTLEEFTEAMNTVRQVVLAMAGKGNPVA